MQILNPLDIETASQQARICFESFDARRRVLNSLAHYVPRSGDGRMIRVEVVTTGQAG